MASRTLLTALGTLLGLQTLRALFPLLVYVLRDRGGLSSGALGAIGLGLFATAFFLPGLARRSGPAALARAALALAAARAALQVWEGDPWASLAIAAVGTVTFLSLLAAGAGAGGVLLGAFLDTATHALFGTRDLHWGGTLADPTTGMLVGMTVALGWAALRAARSEGPESAPAMSGLLAWGPFLYLHVELLGNVARLSARAGQETAVAGMLTALGLAWALLLAAHVPDAGSRLRGLRWLLPAAALGVGVATSEATGGIAPVTLLAAQVGAAALLLRAVLERGASGDGGVAFGAGAVAFLASVFAHYAGYDLDLPVRREGVLAFAGALLALAAFRHPPPARSTGKLVALGLATSPLAFLPLARPQLFPPSDPPERADAGAVRAVTLNLHAGFDERGAWSFDGAMARLREAQPDVVALQEVSRGWLINGCADLHALSQHALGLAGAPAPSVRSDWGNAILARWPQASFRNVPLPPRTLPIPRAVAVAEFHPAGMPRIRVLATHLHHPEADWAVRVAQAEALAALETPDGRAAEILLGDLNDLPDSECLKVLGGAGWRDVGGAATFPSAAPERRIDTVLHRGAWMRAEASVAPPWGSDHRAVIADLAPEAPGG